jgi:hypothetical protein
MAKTLTPDTEAVIPQVGTMLYVDAPFDQATEAIRAGGGNLASAYDVARARMDKGSTHSLSTYGSWVKEGFVYAPKQNPLLVRESPLVEARLARDATNAHRAGKDFYLDDAMAKGFVSQAEEDASKPLAERRVLRFGKAKDYTIPTNRFGDDEVTQFLFKDVAADYGRFLASSGIKQMPVWFADKSGVDKSEMPFLRQLWFHWLGVDGQSGLFGSGWNLLYGNWVRGVRSSSGEAGARDITEVAGKSELGYDAETIAGYVTTLKGVRSGNIANSELERVLEFVQGLPVKN